MQDRWRPAAMAIYLITAASLPSFAQSVPQPGPVGSRPSAEPRPGPSETQQPGAPAARSSNPTGQTGTGAAAPESTGLFERNKLLGDPGGLRTRLGELGISPGLADTEEVFGNPTGGRHTGVTYEGATEISLGIDTDKLFGLHGGTLNVSAFQFHGRGLGVNNIGALQPTSSSEQNVRGARLFELWYEQVFFDKKFAVRVGQQSADQEFLISQLAGLFINSVFGFPTLPSLDLPSGGPAYPLATPAVRLKVVPNDQTTVLLAVFNGDPAGPGLGDPQRRDGGGTAFRLNDGVFVIGEVQYAINANEGATGLPGTYKLGGWYNSQNFPDQSFRNDGLSRADPSSTEAARLRRNDYSVYVVADQTVWRAAGVKDGGIGVFARVMGAPSDRNLIDVYAQGGVDYKGPFAGRDNDTVGFALSYAHISNRTTRLDRDRAGFSGVATPIRHSETLLELTYQAQLAPWWQIQPDFQYIFSPGAGIPDPSRPTRRIGDAAILGLRTNVTF